MALTSPQNAGVSLNLKTCGFFNESVKYLGQIIKPGSLTIDEAGVKSSSQHHYLWNVAELRSFLGLGNLHRRLVPNYTDNAIPLTKFLQKGKPKNFPALNDHESQAFPILV